MRRCLSAARWLEYDGQYWHRDRLARDRAKTDALLRAGWSAIRVREDGLPLLDIDDASLFQIQTPVGARLQTRPSRRSMS